MEMKTLLHVFTLYLVLFFVKKGNQLLVVMKGGKTSINKLKLSGRLLLFN